MSGLDGLGWPNPEDEPKQKKTMNSQLEIKLAPTPETDAMEYFDAMCDPDRVVEADFARKLERERDELREWTSVNGVSSLAKDRDQFRARLREEQQLHVQTLNERDELILAVRGLKRAKGRFHTEQAAINLFELLP